MSKGRSSVQPKRNVSVWLALGDKREDGRLTRVVEARADWPTKPARKQLDSRRQVRRPSICCGIGPVSDAANQEDVRIGQPKTCGSN